MCEVIVLFEGYSEEIDDATMRANCSCVLIKASKLIVVDTMTAWDRDRIIDALARENVRPADIDYVVSTHSHADHIGNNNLFLNAEHIVGTCVHRGDTFYDNKFNDDDHFHGEYCLCPGIKVVKTPGHTSDDVTVLVETSLNQKDTRYAITGDLFEKEADISNPNIWKELGLPELQSTQSQMRSRIINMADFIVPGHGPMFTVTEDLRNMVFDQQIAHDN